MQQADVVGGRRAGSRRDHGAAFEGVADLALQRPAGEVDRLRGRVAQDHVLLRLRPADRQEIERVNRHHALHVHLRRVRDRGGGDAAIGRTPRAGVEQKRAARREIVSDHALDLFAGPVLNKPIVNSPPCRVEVSVRPRRGIRRIGIDRRRDLAHARFEQSVDGTRRLQPRVHQRPHAAHEHLLHLRRVVDDVVDRTSCAGREQDVRDQVIVEVVFRAVPDMPLREIHIPYDRLPFARPVRVPIEVVIFVAVIGIAVQEPRHQIVDGRGDVHVVIGIGLPAGDRFGDSKTVRQCAEIAVVLLFARLFFNTGHDIRIVDFVQRAFRIKPVAFQHAIIAVFHQIHDAVEGAVELHANRQGEMVGRTVRQPRPMGKGVARLGLVRIVGQQVDILHPPLIHFPQEPVFPGEVKIIALLRETERGLSVQRDPDVVVEIG